MNLDLFNRVNLKENSQNKGMYSDWTSLAPLLKSFGDIEQSVLGKFGSAESKEVTLNVVRQLSSNLGISQAAEPSPLNTDHEVLWCMEVICYGLSLPLTEQEAIKDCVSIYCDWLTALLQSPKLSVPKPVCNDPNVYARKIIGHFHFLFVPRQGEGIDIINKQAVLCHRVLRSLKTVAHESKILERSTWEALLLFLLAINDTLLAPPTVKDDVADQLCERVLSVLFEIWLLACAHSFPSPPLWKTLRESCLNWRHRIALVEQWNRVNLALTTKLLSFMYAPDFPQLKLGEDDLIPSGMSNDCIAQSWYRMLNTIGAPICLTRPEVVSQTQAFLQSAISPAGLVDPCQHPSLQALPTIFLKAMKGIAGQVDAFLGIAQPACWEAMVIGSASDKQPHYRDAVAAAAATLHRHSDAPPLTGDTMCAAVVAADAAATAAAAGAITPTPTPPTQRRLAKSFSATNSAQTKGMPKASLMGLTSSRIPSIAHQSSQHSSAPASSLPFSSSSSIGAMESRLPLAPGRPKCNSVLHLFGDWLFQAAFVGSDIMNRSAADNLKRPNSIVIDSTLKSSISYSQPSSLSNGSDLGHNVRTDRYREGRAEALGTLCRIVCSKKTGEEILPVYLARFYLAVSQGMKISANKEYIDTVAGILMNATDMFRLDLDGARMLLPAFLSALELVLPDREQPTTLSATMRTSSNVELRRASIHLLLSMLVLPLHFQNAVIKELISTGSTDRPITFAQLKPRLINLIMNGLQGETDPQNTHMLLGGLFLCVQDSAIYEKVEQVSTQPSAETSSNLLSSVSETSSTISGSTYSDQRLSSLDVMSDLQPIDSAHALFVRATYLVCHRLISSWKTDLNVSLAALELLSGLARIHIKDSDALECKRAVKWLCDYIIHQCSRPPQSHSKDLHSTIVAAFHCCSIWVLEHPYILKDKESLTTVLEVAELGVSGTKSVGKPGEKIKMKDEKELKPVSMRVRDAAENLLTLILEQVGYFPSDCGPESLSSLLDEMSLLQHCNSWSGHGESVEQRQSKAVERFRYFVSENSVMLALLEEPLGNEQDAQPTVTVLIRDPFGRHAWTMQLRHLPRHRSGSKYHAPNLGRPVAMQDESVRPEVKQKYFPDSIERVQTCAVDQSIPSLEAIFANDQQANDETNKIAKLLDRQRAAENHQLVEQRSLEYNECSPPQVCNEFQTARLFLSHFGLLNLDGNDCESRVPALIALNSSDQDFCRDLLRLDSMSPRTCDTVHIFYVRSHETIASSIVNNTCDESTLSPCFMQFIRSLGWPVNVATHPGWTGHISTSWKLHNANVDNNMKHCLFDGQSEVLYWADACSEIAFVLPSDLKAMLREQQDSSLTSWCDRTLSLSEQQNKDKRTLSLDLDKAERSQHRSKGRCNSGGGVGGGGGYSHMQRHCNTKIMVVWLETYEDHLQLPIVDLLPSMETGLETAAAASSSSSAADMVLVIGLHLMGSGLLRVRLQLGNGAGGAAAQQQQNLGGRGGVSIASPLIDGMVVSRRTLGPLVRQTALNMSRRRTLESDTHHSPHVRRRLKIQEIVNKYKREMTTPELLTYLFTNPL